MEYKINSPITAQEFIDLLKRSTLAERRPVDNLVCMEQMVANSNLCISAWDDNKLVGVARSVTDFVYACYVSDLAVDQQYQKRGIGRQLIRLTQQQLAETCKVILISAPQANDYYPRLGFEQNPRCWVLSDTLK